MRSTEVNKVAVEKAFASLASSGDVPGCVTVVSEGVPSLSLGSISPGSSVSEAEVWAMKKELEDVKRKLVLAERRVELVKVEHGEDGQFEVASDCPLAPSLYAELQNICEDGWLGEQDHYTGVLSVRKNVFYDREC
jgi:hypothetical protein